MWYGSVANDIPYPDRRLPMTTIPQVAAVMQTILTDAAERAGRQTGFVQRADAKLTGRGLVQTLVFGLGAHPHARLSDLTQTAAAVGVQSSPEALHQRLDRTAANGLEPVLCAAIRQVVTADPVVLPILERFAEVVVPESTTITLPDALADVWPGCGTGTGTGGAATLQLQVALDLRTGRLRGPTLHDGRAPDQHATLDHDLPPGAVRVVDLGYFDLAHLRALADRGVYWLARMQAMTAIQTADGRWWTLQEMLAGATTPTLDVPVQLGRDAQVAARLVAVRAPQEVVDQRRRRLQANGQAVSAVRPALAAWTVLVTTIPPDLLTGAEALILARARRQIERLFKLWKSHGQIDLVRAVQPWRVLCERYGRVLSQIVQHWIMLISGWDEPARSWTNAAPPIRTQWLGLATALPHRDRLMAALTTVARCSQTGCRKNRRVQHPCAFQRFEAAAENCVGEA